MSKEPTQALVTVARALYFTEVRNGTDENFDHAPGLRDYYVRRANKLLSTLFALGYVVRLTGE